jgi:2,3-bisphosphoglycerate-dependent phosphoglycerate mutase
MTLMSFETLILVRHAQSAGPEPDAELTPLGQQQAMRLAEQLCTLNISSIYSSPYRRAQSTAQPLANRIGMTISTLEKLRERLLSTTPVDDWLEHIFRSFTDLNYRLPNAESLRDTLERAHCAFREMSQTDGGVKVAISHGNLIASVLNGINPAFGFEDWKAMRNPDVYVIRIENGLPVSYLRGSHVL